MNQSVLKTTPEYHAIQTDCLESNQTKWSGDTQRQDVRTAGKQNRHTDNAALGMGYRPGRTRKVHKTVAYKRGVSNVA